MAGSGALGPAPAGTTTELWLFEPHAKSTLEEHRAQRIASVAGRRAKQYMKREHVLEVGEPAHDYLTEVIHRRPREWDNEIDRLHELLQLYGKDALRGAFQHALVEQTFGAEYVAHVLGDNDEGVVVPFARDATKGGAR